MTQSLNTALIPEPAGPLATDDDLALHKLGLQYIETTELSKAISLERAVIIYKARAIYGGRGRESQMPIWLDRYAPDLSLKHAQRLANIVEYFACGTMKLDSVSNLSELEALLQNFKLTALYRLATATVPAAARKEALTQAVAGVTVTPALALELIEKHTIPTDSSTEERVARPRKKDRETIVVDGGGKVTIRSSDGDFLKTLKLAVKQLERMAAASS